QVLERTSREIKLRNARLEGAPLWRERGSVRGVADGQLIPPEGQPGPRVHFIRRFIHGIVNGAAEIPHRNDGAALPGRQDEKRIIEARVAAHVSATVGPPPSTSGAIRIASATPSFGRRCTTSKCECSSRSRMRVP